MKTQERRLSFPNFCSYETLFPLLLVASLIALLVALSGGYSAFWTRLAVAISIYTLIVVLTSALLCWQRKALMRGSVKGQSIRVLITSLLVCFLATRALLYIFHFDFGTRNFLTIGYLLTTAIAVIILLRALYLQQQWQQVSEQGQEAKLQALQARIQPHFLFNSLNCLTELITSDPKKAVSSVYAMSNLFRSSFNPKNTTGNLASELRLIQDYLFLEQIRLGDRLTVCITSPKDHGKTPLLQFLIQPIVENAIRHGIEPSVAGGEISITTKKSNNHLVIEVANTIPTPKPKSNVISKQGKQGKQEHTGNQFALTNIQERLRLSYGKQAFTSLRTEGNQTVMSVFIPIR